MKKPNRENKYQPQQNIRLQKLESKEKTVAPVSCDMSNASTCSDEKNSPITKSKSRKITNRPQTLESNITVPMDTETGQMAHQRSGFTRPPVQITVKEKSCNFHQNPFEQMVKDQVDFEQYEENKKWLLDDVKVSEEQIESILKVFERLIDCWEKDALQETTRVVDHQRSITPNAIKKEVENIKGTYKNFDKDFIGTVQAYWNNVRIKSKMSFIRGLNPRQPTNEQNIQVAYRYRPVENKMNLRKYKKTTVEINNKIKCIKDEFQRIDYIQDYLRTQLKYGIRRQEQQTLEFMGQIEDALSINDVQPLIKLFQSVKSSDKVLDVNKRYLENKHRKLSGKKSCNDQDDKSDKKRKRENEDNSQEDKSNNSINTVKPSSELQPHYKERPFKAKIETTENDFIKLPNEILSIALHSDSLKTNYFRGVKDQYKTNPNEKPNDIVNNNNDAINKETKGVFQIGLTTKRLEPELYDYPEFQEEKFDDVLFAHNKAQINDQIWMRSKHTAHGNAEKIFDKKIDVTNSNSDSEEDKNFVSKLKKNVANQFKNYKSTTKQKRQSSYTTTLNNNEETTDLNQ